MKKAILRALLALVVAYAIFVLGNLLGVNWWGLQMNFLAFLQTLGLLLLLFTGSAAAFEIARYYRKKTLLLDETESASSLTSAERRRQQTLAHALEDDLPSLRAELEKVNQRLASPSTETTPPLEVPEGIPLNEQTPQGEDGLPE
ncbi:MAG: hypothetical protein ACR2GR_00850 [Rhodothermales bacterium]